MTTYPGDDPQPHDDAPKTADPDDTEPTQPVGYWERQAREQAAQQGGAPGSPYPTTPYTQGGPVFNPTSAQSYPPPQQPPGGQNPYGQDPYSQEPYGQNPYGQGPYSQNPYGQAPHGQPGPGYAAPSAGPAQGQPAPGQPGPAPGQPAPYLPMPPYAGYATAAPDHPQATLSLVLGLVGLVGGLLFCGLPLLVSPFAWAIGHSALKEIRASQGRLGGEGNARTGMILGIIGTVLVILAVLALVLFIVLIGIGASTTSTGSSV